MRRRMSLLLSLVLALSLVAPGMAAAKPQTTSATKPKVAVVQQPDAFESVDDTWTTAPDLGNTVTNHTFTNDTEVLGNYTTDVDWFKVSVADTGTPILVNVMFTGGNGGSRLDVFDTDGSRCVTDSIAFFRPGDTNSGAQALGGYETPGWWMSGMAHGYFIAPHPGTYYFRHRADDDPWGPGVPRDLTLGAQEGGVSFELRVTVGDADRLAGWNRYATSAYVSRMMWNGSENPYWWEGPWGRGVILVSGENFADGLAATTLSLRGGMPIMLTGKDSLPKDVAEEIVRLGAEDYWNSEPFVVYVVGTDKAISDSVFAQAEALDHTSNVVRIAGESRYDTAAELASAADAMDLWSIRATSVKRIKPMQPNGGREAFVINGAAWPDGLAAGPVAAFGGAPLLMVTKQAVPPATADWIEAHNVTEIHVCGGPSVVASSVLEDLASLSTTPVVDRIAGADRYETMYLLAKFGIDKYRMVPGATLVSGDTPWDALSGGQVSFMTYEPLMLTPRNSLSPYVVDLYDDYGGFQYAGYVVGGPLAVGQTPYVQFRDLWKRPVRPIK